MGAPIFLPGSAGKLPERINSFTSSVQGEILGKKTIESGFGHELRASLPRQLPVCRCPTPQTFGVRKKR